MDSLYWIIVVTRKKRCQKLKTCWHSKFEFQDGCQRSMFFFRIAQSYFYLLSLSLSNSLSLSLQGQVAALFANLFNTDGCLFRSLPFDRFECAKCCMALSQSLTAVEKVSAKKRIGVFEFYALFLLLNIYCHFINSSFTFK